MPRGVKTPLTEAVQGDKREALEAIRDRLAAELDGQQACAKCGGSISSNTAAVAKQLVEVIERLAAITPPKESQVDQIAKQRARRRSAGASDGASTSGERGAGDGRARGKRGTAS